MGALPFWLCGLGVVVLGAAVARKWPVPEAVVWCALGFGFAFLPGAGQLRFRSDVALFVLLPPLVYAAAVRLPWPEFRDNLRPIGLLAFGLVIVNAVAAAAVLRRLAGLDWALALALGAVVSPTDPAAASTVASRVGLPARLVAILEGEGLVNDAVALTLLRLAAVAAATGAFSLQAGALRFAAIMVGEPLYGWLVGVAFLWLRRRIADPRLEITFSLLTPFAAYLLPERLGGSGILATVAAGMYVGERRSDVVPAGTRLHATSVWDVIVFVLNGALFFLAGLEVREIVRARVAGADLLEWGLAVAGAMVVLRAAWCGAMWGVFRGRRMLKEGDGRPMPARHMAVVAWSGMRGPISLAAALSLPTLIAGLRPADYETVLFVTAAVIAVTLIIQGVALPYVIRWLGVSRDAERNREEDGRQRAFAAGEAARAAVERVAALEAEGSIGTETADRLRRYYRDRASDARDGHDTRRAMLQLIEAERARLYRLRNEGRVNDRVLGELERTLDLRQSTLTSGGVEA